MLAEGWCEQAAGPTQIVVINRDLRVAKTCKWSKEDETNRYKREE